jgi:hypothetical protein
VMLAPSLTVGLLPRWPAGELRGHPLVHLRSHLIYARRWRNEFTYEVFVGQPGVATECHPYKSGVGCARAGYSKSIRS